MIMPSPFPNVALDKRGTVQCVQFDSMVLKANPWGDPSMRDVWVYVPNTPGDPTEYPVVMLLAGFGNTGEGMLSRSLTDIPISTRIDQLIHSDKSSDLHTENCPPFIAVLPDCMTRLGGSQFIDSVGIGNYASWLVEEVIPFVDTTFPTTKRWAVAGRSSGGFGALNLAMTFPGKFEGVACHAGDMGFDLAYLSEIPNGLASIQAAGGPMPFLDQFWSTRRPSAGQFAAFNLLCLSAAYSPTNEDSEFPGRLPVDWRTGEIDFDVFASWRTHDPLVKINQHDAQRALRDLGVLFLDVGNRDEYHLHLGARRFVSRLRDLDIPYIY